MTVFGLMRVTVAVVKVSVFAGMRGVFAFVPVFATVLCWRFVASAACRTDARGEVCARAGMIGFRVLWHQMLRLNSGLASFM